MTLLRYCTALLVGLLCVRSLPADPIQLIPDEADLVIKIPQPRRLFDLGMNHDLVSRLRSLGAVQEAYDSTNVHRLEQLVEYFERQLGVSRADLLERVAGKGLALAFKLGPGPTPRMLVIQGTDEALVQRFFQVARDVAAQELARQEAKDSLQSATYNGVAGFRIGNEFHAAAIGSAIVLSNFGPAIQKAVDLHRNAGGKSLASKASLMGAQRLLGPEALAWMWLNLESVRQSPEAKELFQTKRNDAQLTVLFGGWLDVARRSPYLSAGLYAHGRDVTLSFRMPAGREGMPPELAAHLPPAGQPGSRPLLEPKGVLYSTSYFMDFSKFWEYRSDLLNEASLKGLEEFNNESGKFLAGGKFSKLLGMAGAYQRVVVAHPKNDAYQTAPAQRIPAFAVVTELRQPEAFSKRLEATLRAVALLASTQVSLKAFEETYNGHRLVGYRMVENGRPALGDPENYRFNFSPCFATIGNQFLAASRVDLGRELIDLLVKEGQQPPGGAPETVRTQVYASGGVAVLESLKDRLFTQIILDRAIPPDEANEQAQAFMGFVGRLGVLKIAANYGAREFHYDIRLQPR